MAGKTATTVKVNPKPHGVVVRDQTDKTRSIRLLPGGETQALVSVETASRQYIVNVDRKGARELINGLVDFLEYRPTEKR